MPTVCHDQSGRFLGAVVLNSLVCNPNTVATAVVVAVKHCCSTLPAASTRARGRRRVAKCGARGRERARERVGRWERARESVRERVHESARERAREIE